MAENDFVPFAIAVGALVQSQPGWLGNAVRETGFQYGIVPPDEFNKALRQPAFVGAALSEWIFEVLVDWNLLDNGDLQAYVDAIDEAIRRRILLYAPKPARVRATGVLSVYVDCFTGSDQNDGLTPTTAFLTIGHAIDYMLNNVDIAGHRAIISVAPGDYNETLTLGCPLLGQKDVTDFMFTVTSVTGGRVNIHGSGWCFALSGGAQMTLNGNYTLDCVNVPGTPNAVITAIGGSRCQFQGQGWLIFGNSPGCIHVLASTGGEFSSGNVYAAPDPWYSVEGGGSSHWTADSGGRIIVQKTNVMPVIGNPTFTNAFAQSVRNGVILNPISTWSGTAVCPRYFAALNGVIDTAGAGATHFPGNSAGSVTSGGQYN